MQWYSDFFLGGGIVNEKPWNGVGNCNQEWRNSVEGGCFPSPLFFRLNANSQVLFLSIITHVQDIASSSVLQGIVLKAKQDLTLRNQIGVFSKP